MSTSTAANAVLIVFMLILIVLLNVIVWLYLFPEYIRWAIQVPQ